MERLPCEKCMWCVEGNCYDPDDKNSIWCQHLMENFPFKLCKYFEPKKEEVYGKI